MGNSMNSKFVPVEEDRRIGKRVGNLRIVDRIGIGGMGAVYRAVHRILETPYAIKILHPRFSEDKAAGERFRHEAIAASRLRHNNVVFVTDFGFDESVKSINDIPPWYQACTNISLPGTGIREPLCATQFSVSSCGAGILK